MRIRYSAHCLARSVAQQELAGFILVILIGLPTGSSSREMVGKDKNAKGAVR